MQVQNITDSLLGAMNKIGAKFNAWWEDEPAAVIGWGALMTEQTTTGPSPVRPERRLFLRILNWRARSTCIPRSAVFKRALGAAHAR